MPKGRVTRSRSASTWAIDPDPGVSSENRVVVRPSCSTETTRLVKRAPGAPTVTSSVPFWPATRSGLSIVIDGGAAASGCNVHRAADHRRENDEHEQPSEHGL